MWELQIRPCIGSSFAWFRLNSTWIFCMHMREKRGGKVLTGGSNQGKLARALKSRILGGSLEVWGSSIASSKSCISSRLHKNEVKKSKILSSQNGENNAKQSRVVPKSIIGHPKCKIETSLFIKLVKNCFPKLAAVIKSYMLSNTLLYIQCPRTTKIWNITSSHTNKMSENSGSAIPIWHWESKVVRILALVG